MIEQIMVRAPRGVKTPLLSALGAGLMAAALVMLMGSATRPAVSVPMPRDRPQMIEEAYVRPTLVRTIPITKSDPGVVARHEPPELYGEPPVNKPTRAKREIVDYLPERRPRDICQKHGMRKEYTNNGRSWRCRR